MKYNSDNDVNSWDQAVVLYEQYITRPKKVDFLLEELASNNDVKKRQSSQFLFLGAVRHLLLIENVLNSLCTSRPKSKLRAILGVAIFEIMAKPESLPKIVDYTVNYAKTQLSASEGGFVNAILRKVPDQLAAFIQRVETKKAADMAIAYSHPLWLVQKWVKAYGAESTESLLKWNQEPPFIYVRNRSEQALSSVLFEKVDLGQDFYKYKGEEWSEVSALLKTGAIYIQDPATQNSVNLLTFRPGMAVLDLCAAPGGKSLLIADALSQVGGSLLVSVDVPGDRIGNLKQNLKKIKPGVESLLVQTDVLSLSSSIFKEGNAPVEYDAILVDVPCSNTGVLRRKPDAKYRLTPNDLEALPVLQLALLTKAAEFLKLGGQLVYSTCSLESEENEGVIAAFLEEHAGFELKAKKQPKPWVEGTDGAGVFLLIRNF